MLLLSHTLNILIPSFVLKQDAPWMEGSEILDVGSEQLIAAKGSTENTHKISCSVWDSKSSFQ
jgi:hypothetical protein